MKVRFIWRYTTQNYGKNGDYSWWGTCEKWAKETVAINGEKVQIIKTRVMWVGKIPLCMSCYYGFH